MNYTLLMSELETEAAELADECTHDNVDYDENNIPFCADCGRELEADKPEEY